MAYGVSICSEDNKGYGLRQCVKDLIFMADPELEERITQKNKKLELQKMLENN